jgi:hypothetical protein
MKPEKVRAMLLVAARSGLYINNSIQPDRKQQKEKQQ